MERNINMDSDIKTQPRNVSADFSRWEEQYACTKHWKGDIDFYQDELNFLRTLIDKYFIWLTESQNINETKSLIQKLSLKDEELQKLSETAEDHLHSLEEILSNTLVPDEEPLSNKHSVLESNFNDFTSTFKSVKKDVFKITEHVMESEKIKRLLNS